MKNIVIPEIINAKLQMARNETPNQGPDALLDLSENIAATPIGSESNNAIMEAETNSETGYWRRDAARSRTSIVITEMNTIRCLRSLSILLPPNPLSPHVGDALMNHSAFRYT